MEALGWPISEYILLAGCLYFLHFYCRLKLLNSSVDLLTMATEIKINIVPNVRRRFTEDLLDIGSILPETLLSIDRFRLELNAPCFQDRRFVRGTHRFLETRTGSAFHATFAFRPCCMPHRHAVDNAEIRKWLFVLSRD